MIRNQYVRNRETERKEKITIAAMSFITAIAILYAGIWIGQLECCHVTALSRVSLHFAIYYLNDIFLFLLYSLLVIIGIGAVIIIATYRRDIYNAQKDVDEIIIKGKEEAVQYKKDGENEAERIVIEAKKAEVLWQRKNRELEEKERQLQREYETAVKEIQSKFDDKIKKKGEENRHLAEKCKMLTDEL